MEFLSLCYHYIRTKESEERFPRILGNPEDAFREHLTMLKKNYYPLSLNQVKEFYYEKKDSLPPKTQGMLITFDDGLSDHYRAAQILSDFGIAGTFFIPTCVLAEKTPANPQIIHYSIAHYGVTKFLSHYHDILAELGFDNHETYRIIEEKNPFETISKIKKAFKYSLPFSVARTILLNIYKNTLLKDFPDILDEIHLNSTQVKKMIEMGHSIGVHSHTHLSVAASKLDAANFLSEIVAPHDYLEKTFGIVVDALSYPFGEKEDCLAAEELIKNTARYKLAFTVEVIKNNERTSPFELGRYMPLSNDNAQTLKGILEKMSTP